MVNLMVLHPLQNHRNQSCWCAGSTAVGSLEEAPSEGHNCCVAEFLPFFWGSAVPTKLPMLLKFVCVF